MNSWSPRPLPRRWHTPAWKAPGQTVPLRVMQQILLQLSLYGLVTQGGGAYRWTIPLLRDTLLADPARAYRVPRLLSELPASFAAWITPQMLDKTSSSAGS